MKNEDGFSSVELVFYMVCIGILLSIGLPRISDYLDKGNRTKTISEIALLSSSISAYRQQMGSYPANLGVLTTASAYSGIPWINQIPTSDPWETTSSGINGTGGVSAYAYSRTTSGFAVWSLGKNKVNNSGGSGAVLPSSFGGDDIGFIGQ